jgi:hypothetical protein
VAPEKIVLGISMGRFTEVTPGKVGIPKEEEQALERAEEAETKRRARRRSLGVCVLAEVCLQRCKLH